jgi:hypothetical protein
LQAWVQNQGEALPYQQGTSISVHFPVDALRVLAEMPTERLHPPVEASAGTG